MGFSRRENWTGCHSLLQGIFQTQGLNLGLLLCMQVSLPSEPPGKLLQTKLLHSASLCEHMFCFSLVNKYLRVNCLHHVVVPWLIFRKMQTRYSQHSQHFTFSPGVLNSYLLASSPTFGTASLSNVPLPSGSECVDITLWSPLTFP